MLRCEKYEVQEELIKNSKLKFKAFPEQADNLRANASETG
jgi:hypothetical protein